MKNEAQKEHQWLQQLLGDWTYEGEADMGPDKPPERFTGEESVRAIGDLWVMGEARGEMPGGEPATMIITLGYDPMKQRYVGSWLGSMMSRLWIYDGSLDEAKKALTLNTEGPDFTVEGKTSPYRDVIEIVAPDYRTLSSYALGEDGQWRRFMLSHYRRKP